ncbi:alpha/beta fold hydrolase [Gordonia sp. SID5947]|uniref:alpha/beta fold hydrolase n=1 Tax=Gordonia sp. SID5947 TaxID=2690315 RepID=UPI0013716377|nr:alpha/beta hydrolase [Gordonia sp. SID5947]MYR06961.1 alpha/beta fold hydrolase [Gordonia sp. SID5947]
MTETFTATAADGTPLLGRRWTPEGDVRAAVVLVHGMGEHSQRYTETAASLVDAGFVVYAYDHRGHGGSVLSGREPGDLGPDGWQRLVADIGVVVDVVHAECPASPLVLIAHSMGSFAAQQFLLDHSDRVDAVVLSGTAALDGLEPALDLDAEIDLSGFNAPFEPSRTDYDWLTRDDAIVDAYVADALCGFGLDAASGKDMFVRARALTDPERVGGMASSLPILIAVGDLDPVNGGLALVDLLVAHYRAGGLTDVSVKVYPGARHEILNEINRDEVRRDLIEWIDGALTRRC